MDSLHPDFRFAIILTILLLAAVCVGYFHPVALDWGVAFAGFLPWPVIILVIILVIITLLLFPRWKCEEFIEKISNLSESSPYTFLGSILVLFITAAIVLRVRASLLGDSYTLIYNFSDYLNGTSILAPWHEPLSIYVLYYLVHWLGPIQYPQIYISFSIVEIVFGCGFILTAFYIVRNFFDPPSQRLLVFLLLLVLPYMEFFLGYIEVYSVSTFLLAVYILCSVLTINGKNYFWLVPPLYVLVTFSHYINGLLGLSLLYLTILEYRKNHVRGVAPGIAAGFLLMIVILTIARFDPDRLIDSSPMSHFLSFTSDITPINAYSQAYTIISLYHALDIGNYFIFISPFAIAFLIWWIVRREVPFRTLTPRGTWLAIATIPIFLFLAVAKNEQGFASDWDVFAAHFFLLNLLFAYIFFLRAGSQGIRSFLFVLVMTAVFTIPWYVLNATREPSIRRFQSLWDTRILSHLGHYTHTLRLSRYYDAGGESEKNIDVWQHYTRLFPGDPRGYENQVNALTQFAPEAIDRRDSVYNTWLHLDPANTTMRHQYGGFCVTVGNLVLEHGDTARALSYYQRAIASDSTQSRAFNNLASIFGQKNDYRRAIPLFQKALALDPQYSDAFYNLGMIYLDEGNKQQADEMILRSAKLGNTAAQSYLKSIHRSWQDD